MRLPRRPTAAAACALLAALALASCGVDAGDQAATATDGGGTTATTAPAEDLSALEEQMVDQATKMYTDLGMEPEDAECLARGLLGDAEGGSFDPSDTEGMMDVINECDISMSDLSDLGSENGITSMEDGIEYGLQTSLEAGGLTPDEAECVASAYVEEYGSDVTAIEDPAKRDALLEGCGVDPSKLGN